MAYSKTTWNTGDTMTQAKMRNIEDGIEAVDGAVANVSLNKDVCNGRLTLETGVPISTTDQSAKGTLYWTPYKGNQIGLYSGSAWVVKTFAELSLSLSGYTDAKPYDIFAYDNSGTVALEALIWTNDTTRATALVLQDGVYVKSGATTRRYLGTIYMSATSQTSDTEAKRYVWNAYNRVRRSVSYAAATDTWDSGNTQSWALGDNGSSTARIDVVAGLAEELLTVELVVGMRTTNAVNTMGAVAIGYDATNAVSGRFSRIKAGMDTHYTEGVLTAFLNKIVAVGRHYAAWLETSFGTVSYFGVYDATNNRSSSGLTGTWMC